MKTSHTTSETTPRTSATKAAQKKPAGTGRGPNAAPPTRRARHRDRLHIRGCTRARAFAIRGREAAIRTTSLSEGTP
jgi:hypothetical protein